MCVCGRVSILCLCNNWVSIVFMCTLRENGLCRLCWCAVVMWFVCVSGYIRDHVGYLSSIATGFTLLLNIVVCSYFLSLSFPTVQFVMMDLFFCFKIYHSHLQETKTHIWLLLE